MNAVFRVISIRNNIEMHTVRKMLFPLTDIEKETYKMTRNCGFPSVLRVAGVLMHNKVWPYIHLWIIVSPWFSFVFNHVFSTILRNSNYNKYLEKHWLLNCEFINQSLFSTAKLKLEKWGKELSTVCMIHSIPIGGSFFFILFSNA